MSSGEAVKRVVNNIYIVGSKPALYIKSSDAIVIADVHLGYEEAMASQGVFIPKTQLRRGLKALKEFRKLVEARRLIINGDLKHSFNKLLRQERVEVEQFIAEASSLGFKEIVLVRGNHDNYVSPLLRRLGVSIVEDYMDLGEGVVLTHGHLDVMPEGDIVVIGHEHPAVQINMGGSKVKFPALLLMPTVKGGLIVVMPAFGSYQTGNIVTLDRNNYLSPLVKSQGVIEDTVPVIIDEGLGAITLSKLEVMGKMLP